MYTERRFQHFRSHPQRQRQNGNGMVETRHYLAQWTASETDGRTLHTDREADRQTTLSCQ